MKTANRRPWSNLRKTVAPLRETNKPHFLGVCAIFHSEQPFLVEWIEFHLKQGFNRFYLYDNELDPKYHEILAPYIAKNQVVHHQWPDNPRQPNWTQRNAYYHCLQNYSSECNWLAFFDIDEFLYPETTLTELPNVISILKQYQKQANPVTQISVVRYNYGNYWHIDTPPIGGVLRNYLTRDKTFSSVKSIINTSYVSLRKPPDTVHHLNELMICGTTLNGEKLPLPLRFNHYLTKSTSEYENRNALWRKKRETQLFNPPDLRRFNQNLRPEEFNQIYDDSILRYTSG